MLRDGTVERIANEICWAVASNLGPNTDCHFLESSIEKAVWLCMMDSPHCEQLDDPQSRLVHRIRQDVESILESYHFDRLLLEHVGGDIEDVVRAGLAGGSHPEDFARSAKREPDHVR